MKHIIQKCLHWITSDIKQTIAEVKYAFRRRSQRVLLAVQMAARVVILVEFVIMSICLDYSWFGEIVVIWYFILLVTDSKHLLSVMQCVLSWRRCVFVYIGGRCSRFFLKPAKTTGIPACVLCKVCVVFFTMLW